MTASLRERVYRRQIRDGERLLKATPEQRRAHTLRFLDPGENAKPYPPQPLDEEARRARERLLFPYDEVLPTPPDP